MSFTETYPVRVLREHGTNLEAALSVCLADSSTKPVHRLRTETRRVEAQLLLLALVPGLPEHRKQANTLLRSLAKLRRAAGEVRDLDVHRKMLEEFAETEEAQANTAGKPRQARKTAAAGSKNGSASAAEAGQTSTKTAHVLSQSATELRKQMGVDRDKHAKALLKLLEARQAKTAKHVEALLTVLQPGEEIALAADALLGDAEAVLQRHNLLQKGDVEALDEDELHALRKAAKAARYLAETLPDNPALTAAAQRFESIQEAGGRWHDALQLSRAARRHFSKNHELTRAYRERCRQDLERYKQILAPEVKQSRAAAKTSKRPPENVKVAKKPASGKRTVVAHAA